MRVGAPSEVPNARTIVPAINKLAQALRRAGGTVAWVQATFEHGGWPLFFEHMVRPEIAARILAALRPGSPDHALWPELAVADGDIVVPKYRFSAFLPGASTLPAILRGRGIDTVLIAGCMTNMCCDFLRARRGHDRFLHRHGIRLQCRANRCRASLRAWLLSHRLRRRAAVGRPDRTFRDRVCGGAGPLAEGSNVSRAGAIDIVVNPLTPRILAARPDWSQSFYTQKIGRASADVNRSRWKKCWHRWTRPESPAPF